MTKLSAAQLARNKLGGYARQNKPDLADDARRDMAAAILEQAIRDAVEAAPPLTAEQRDKLAALLLPPVEDSGRSS